MHVYTRWPAQTTRVLLHTCCRQGRLAMVWAAKIRASRMRHSFTCLQSRRHLRNPFVSLLTIVFLIYISQVWNSRAASTRAGAQCNTQQQQQPEQPTSLLLPTLNTLNMRAAAHSSQFVIVIITASRPGNISYLPRTLQSLDCALQPPESSHNSSSSSSLPQVLAVNTEVPSSQHVVFEAFKQQHSALQSQASQRASLLRFLDVGALHQQLHSPDFVLELAKRCQDGYKAPASAGEAASDPASRLWWRSKEALDTAYVLEAGLRAAPGVAYIIFLQDDAILASGFATKLEAFIANQSKAGEPPDIIKMFTVGEAAAAPAKHVGHTGCVGLVIRADIVPELVAYVRSRFTAAPMDWLLGDFTRDRNTTVWAFHPNLAQHVGLSRPYKRRLSMIRRVGTLDVMVAFWALHHAA